MDEEGHHGAGVGSEMLDSVDSGDANSRVRSFEGIEERRNPGFAQIGQRRCSVTGWPPPRRFLEKLCQFGHCNIRVLFQKVESLSCCHSEVGIAVKNLQVASGVQFVTEPVDGVVDSEHPDGSGNRRVVLDPFQKMRHGGFPDVLDCIGCDCSLLGDGRSWRISIKHHPLAQRSPSERWFAVAAKKEDGRNCEQAAAKQEDDFPAPGHEGNVA